MAVRTAFCSLALLGILLVSPARADDAPASSDEERSSATNPSRWDDTGRFYLLFGSGAVFLLDDKFAGDTHFDSHEFRGTNVNIPEDIGVGYNFSQHWGVEIQGLGTEPDIRSDSAGKLGEYSNISVFGSLRYRHPIGDGRFVPWALGGIGWSLNDFNDSTTPRIKVTGDGSTIAGTVAVGFDYFLAEDVAVGASTQAMFYPSIDTEVLDKNTFKTVRGSNDLTAIALLLHVKMFLGATPSGGGSEGGHRFDSNELRYYLFGVGGDHLFFDDSYGGTVKAKAAGSSNWTLGGGFGVNLDEHWGAELALLTDSDLNINDGELGKIGEMGIFTVMPTGRFRWQFWDGRLVPFATAGLGFAVNQPNDPRNLVDVFQKHSQRTPKIDIQTASIAGSVGIGVEYFLNRHISVGLALPLMIYPDWDTKVQARAANGSNLGRPVKGSWNYTGIFPNFRLTAYIP